jgi:hypothetical protein
MDSPLSSLSHCGLAYGLNRTFSKLFFFPSMALMDSFEKKSRKTTSFKKLTGGMS